jgi:uncharacterized protein YkwD
MNRFLKHRAKLFPIVMLLVPLMGAQCSVSGSNAAGPSTTVTPVPGSGTTAWYFGSFPYDPLTFSGDLFDQINLERTTNGLAPLVWHDGVALCAQLHSADMRAKGYTSIVSPEGIDPYERMVSSNPPINFDEAYGFVALTQTPTQVFAQLLADTNGRLAIYDPNATHYGASFQSNPGPYSVTVLIVTNPRS